MFYVTYVGRNIKIESFSYPYQYLVINQFKKTTIDYKLNQKVKHAQAVRSIN